MTKRVLAGLLALGLAAGIGACGKSIDKEGTVDNLVEAGVPHEQAECIVDGVDQEFGDNDDVIDELTQDDPELSPEDQQTLTDIVVRCDAEAGGTDTTGTDTTGTDTTLGY